MKQKNEHAQALGRLGGIKRAKNMTAAERKEAAAELLKARHKSLSAERRSEIARQAARARWSAKSLKA